MKYEEYLIIFLQKCAKSGAVPPLEKLRRLQNTLFPVLQLTGKPVISSKWKTALHALSLLPFGSSNEAKKAERVFIKHILENCIFPSSCWQSYLENIGKWIALESAPGPPHFSVCQTLSFQALSQIIFHLSAQKKFSTSWRESLLLYKFLSEKSTFSHTVSVAAAHHCVLITLLRNGKWDKALTFFYDILNHKVFPSPSATGFLITSLGENNKWSEILSIYDISVKYASKKLPCSYFQNRRGLQKRWGTVFSMAMNNATKDHSYLLFSMMDKLILYNQRSSVQPIGLLDGNFLQSVERLSVEERLKLLSIARKYNLLDYFKVIRGLVSQKRWIDALETFCTVMKFRGSEIDYCLSRAEIGKSRLALLHSSNSSNVRGIVERINNFKRDSDTFLLNDAELECIFSKSLGSDVSSFWMYCLRLLDSNFSFNRLTNKKRVLPSRGMLSLLFRNKKLPWMEGLKIFYLYMSNYSDTSTTDKNKDKSISLSVVLDSLVRLMYFNNAQKEADDLVLRMTQLYNVTLPGIFLQRSKKKILQAVISANRKIASPTLYYILGDYRETDEKIPRAILCLHLYMKAELGHGFLEGSCRPENEFKWLNKVPASVHVQALRCIARCGLPESAKYALTKQYMSFLICQNSQKNAIKNINESLYCIVYESFIVFLEYYNIKRNGDRKDSIAYPFFEYVLELAVSKYQSFPPFYMFLPNQLDRLLPRFSPITASISNITFRCAFGKKVISLIIGLFQEGRQFVPSQLVVLNGLLKLCCRIAEYEKAVVEKKIVATDSEEVLLNLDSEVADYAIRLIKWEIEISNSSAISSHLLFLYKIISSSCCKKQCWEKALELTSLALRGSEKNSSNSEDPGISTEKYVSRVNSLHYKEFSRNFGWETGLSFWYKYYPCEVLKNISKNSCAVDYCFSLSI